MSWRSPSVVEELVPAADVELVEPALELAADVDVDASPVELSGTTSPPERPEVVAGCL